MAINGLHHAAISTPDIERLLERNGQKGQNKLMMLLD
jgi:hypothetical protein